MKLTIKRKEWLHGEGTSRSYLLRPDDGKKCCLGILGMACGISPATLRGYKDPADLLVRFTETTLPPDYQWTVARHGATRTSDAAQDAMRVNDVRLYETTYTLYGTTQSVMLVTEEQREQLIAKIFSEHGIDVQFED